MDLRSIETNAETMVAWVDANAGCMGFFQFGIRIDWNF